MPLNSVSATPLSAVEFRDLMGRVGEPGPATCIAVAVSGGADSLALLLLAAEWAATRGVKVTALTMDHGLRPGSAKEAAQVSDWCRDIRVAHESLDWIGEKPATGVQEAAREARYARLSQWCRDHDHPDLLMAHHLDDQAETILMRMSRGSGINGLAGMPLVTVRDGVRIIRPLLRISRQRLVAFLQSRKHRWIEDPTNLDRRYTRVAVRDELTRLDAVGLPSSSFSRVARAFGSLRAERDREVARLAAFSVAMFPEGFAEMDGDLFRDAEPDLARDLLARLLAVVGGRQYPIRRKRLNRLFGTLRTGGIPPRQTLGRCLVEPVRGGFRLCREPGTVRDVRPVSETLRLRWDNRFDLELCPERLRREPSARVRALGQGGRLPAMAGALQASHLPRSVCFGLPSLWIGDEVAEVPHLGYAADDGSVVTAICFRPGTPLCGPPFRLA